MARAWRIALLGLLFGVMAGRLPAQPWGGPAAFGIEVEDAKGKPVSGAEVELVSLAPGGGGPAPVRTDTRGRVTIFGLAEGPWTISIKHPGFLAYTADLTVLTGKAPKPSTPALLKHSDSLESIKVKFSKAEGPPRGRGDALPAPTPPVVKPTPPPPPAPTPAPVTPPPAAPKPSAPAAAPTPSPVPPPSSPAPAPAPKPTPAPPVTTTPPAVAPAPAPSPPPPAVAPAPAPSSPPKPVAPAAAPPVVVKPAAPAAPTAQAPPVAAPEPMPAPPAAAPKPAPTPPPQAPAAPAPVAPAPASTPAPTPAPAPVPPVAAAPRLAAPAARMPVSALPRSARDGSCPDCQAGQWAVDVEVVGGPAGEVCPGDLSARWNAVFAPPAVMPNGLAGYAGPLRDAATASWVSSLGSDLATRLERELAPYLTAGNRCQLAAVLVPAGAHYTGFRLRGEDGTRCSALGECPGGGRFLGPIVRVKTEAGLFIAVPFEGTGTAELTVYFAPGTWQTPTGRRR